MEHVFYKCPPNSMCMERNVPCIYCDGGLSLCTVCNQAEGELTETCPGPKTKNTMPTSRCLETIEKVREWTEVEREVLFRSLAENFPPKQIAREILVAKLSTRLKKSRTNSRIG